MTGKSIPAYKENGMPHPHTFHRFSNKKLVLFHAKMYITAEGAKIELERVCKGITVVKCGKKKIRQARRKTSCGMKND